MRAVLRTVARSVFASIAIASLSLLVAGCARRAGQSNASRIDRDEEAYVRLVLALAERDPDSLDAYWGPPVWRAAARDEHLPLADVRGSARALLARLNGDRGSAPDQVRLAFLRRQLQAIIARIDLLAGARYSFAEESRLLFGVSPPPVDREQTTAIREMLDRILPGRGDLTHRVADFQRRLVVPPDRLSKVLSRAIAECRRVTLQHVGLPANERVTIDYVHDLPWSAFTRYEGDHRSRITINTRLGLTVDDVLQLACHEAYPGHHAINVLVDDRLVGAEHRKALMVQPLFSPQSLLAEGAASIAPQLALPDAERRRFEQTTLFPLAGIDPDDAELSTRVSRLVDALAPLRSEIAARYLDGDLEFIRAAGALEREAVTLSPDAVLKFVNQFRTYAVAYARGPELATAFLDANVSGHDVAARWRAYVQLVTNPNQAFETPPDRRQ